MLDMLNGRLSCSSLQTLQCHVLWHPFVSNLHVGHSPPSQICVDIMIRMCTFIGRCYRLNFVKLHESSKQVVPLFLTPHFLVSYV
jgi:hypothetical protein